MATERQTQDNKAMIDGARVEVLADRLVKWAGLLADEPVEIGQGAMTDSRPRLLRRLPILSGIRRPASGHNWFPALALTSDLDATTEDLADAIMMIQQRGTAYVDYSRIGETPTRDVILRWIDRAFTLRKEGDSPSLWPADSGMKGASPSIYIRALSVKRKRSKAAAKPEIKPTGWL